MKAQNILSIFLIAIVLSACGFEKNVQLFKKKELADGSMLLLHEVAIIDSLQNEHITMIPQHDNVLLVSVMEYYNKTTEPITVKTFFEQKIMYEDKEYDSIIFSLDGEVINPYRQAYVYFISEVPDTIYEEETMQKPKKNGVELRFSLGEEYSYLYKGVINNNFGLQDNISNKYNKILKLRSEFDSYWSNDLSGFVKKAKSLEQIKNYNKIYDWVFSTQKEYDTLINMLDSYLDGMNNIRLITPIYPDANVKIRMEAESLRNLLVAINSVENTCDTKEGVQLFIDNCQKSLADAYKQNDQKAKEFSKMIFNERQEYGGFRD